jgi:hypothetical protein
MHKITYVCLKQDAYNATEDAYILTGPSSANMHVIAILGKDQDGYPCPSRQKKFQVFFSKEPNVQMLLCNFWPCTIRYLKKKFQAVARPKARILVLGGSCWGCKTQLFLIIRPKSA